MDIPSAIRLAFERGAALQGLRDRRVTVMGLGRFGGGVGVVNFLQSQGAQVTVTDLASAEDLTASLQQIDVNSLAGLKLGTHDPRDFTETDLVVVNPAVKRTNPLLLQAAQAGVPLTSEMNLFCQRNLARTIAVTGSVGKSTTVSLIQAMLSANGLQSHLGGNIGGSLLGKLDQISPDDWVVLELSSFQLWDLDHLQFAPEVAVVTNLFPHHLDWHGSFEAYAEAKATMTRWQTSAQWLVYPAGDFRISHWQTRAKLATFNNVEITSRERNVLTDTITDWPQRLAGKSHRLNVAAALAAVVFGLNLSPEVCLSALQSFSHLPHRREDLGVHRGRRFINDSKATTPYAAISAIREISCDSGRLLLIAGGADQGADLQDFRAEIEARVAAVALLGEAGERLADRLQESSTRQRVMKSDSLADAFWGLLRVSEPGDTLLLAPGCASYGEFLNYEQRGDTFRRLVQRFAETSNSLASEDVVR